MPLSSTKHGWPGAAILKFLAVGRGVQVNEGIMDMPVGACAESASE